MNSTDIVFLHPPSFYDFRKELWFPGPIANTVPICTPVFMMFPIGFISMGAYLEDNGVKVRIVNIAERMFIDNNFDVEDFLKRLSSNIYAIDLHWIVHAQGAIEIAKICKKYHPESIVLLGGLTSTYFAKEIIRNFHFIDCILKGEGEYAILKLIHNVSKFDKINAFYHTPNLIFIDKNKNTIIETETMETVDTIDHFDFTRLRLVEPGTRALTPPFSKSKIWSLPICRGCVYNCASCGGSNYAYKKLMKRERLAFRSPERILEDLMILDEQKVSSVFLFQDPRMGGIKYFERLLNVLKMSKWSYIRTVGFELFEPIDRSFLNYLIKNKPAENIALTISPESGVEDIRRKHGREYSNAELLLTIQYCKRQGISLGVFFMSGLGYETFDTLKETWNFWKKISLIEKEVKSESHIFVEFGPMIFLDPGSLAFDYPEKYGYKIKFKRFNDYYQAIKNSPYWAHWISYETSHMNTFDLTYSILNSLEEVLKYKKECGLISDKEFERGKMRIDLEKVYATEFNKIIKIEDSHERMSRIKELDIILKDPVLIRSYLLTHSTSS
ncbi:MAG: radical SAM protein [Nitrososphaeria archaeon]